MESNPYEAPHATDPPRRRPLLRSLLFDLSVLAGCLSLLWVFLINFVTFVEPISGETHLLAMACLGLSIIAITLTAAGRESEAESTPESASEPNE